MAANILVKHARIGYYPTYTRILIDANQDALRGRVSIIAQNRITLKEYTAKK